MLVTDIRMPGTDGTALMRAALERDAEMPVILVTGMATWTSRCRDARRGL
jgi:FixJ family two-component response regulator